MVVHPLAKEEPSAEERQPDVAVGAIIENPWGEILLIKQKKWGDQYSCFVGGHIKRGETKLAALRREVREEVDIEIGSCEFINEDEFIEPNNPEDIHYIFYNYLCPVNSSHFYCEEGGEIDYAEWVMPERAVELVLERNRPILQKLLETGTLGSTSGKRTALASK